MVVQFTSRGICLISNKFICKGYLTLASFYIASAPATLMEVVKAIAKQEPTAHENVAIRADQKSYSYKELISSAQKISNLLCASDAQTVSHTLLFSYYCFGRTKPTHSKSLKAGDTMFSLRKLSFLFYSDHLLNIED